MTTTTNVLTQLTAAVSCLTAAARHLTEAGTKHHAAAVETLRSHVEATLKAHEAAAATPAPVKKTSTVQAPAAAQTPAPSVKAAPAAIPSDGDLASKAVGLLVRICQAHGVDHTDGKGKTLSGPYLRKALQAARIAKAAPAAAKSGPVNANVAAVVAKADATKAPAPKSAAVPAPAAPVVAAALSSDDVVRLAMLHNLSGGSIDTLRERLAAMGVTAPAAAQTPAPAATTNTAPVAAAPAPVATPAPAKAKCTGKNADGSPCGNFPVKGQTTCRRHPAPAPKAPAAAQTPAPTAKLGIPDDATLEKLTPAQLTALFARLDVRTQRLILATAR